MDGNGGRTNLIDLKNLLGFRHVKVHIMQATNEIGNLTVFGTRKI